MESKCFVGLFVFIFSVGLVLSRNTNELDIEELKHTIPGLENDTNIPSVEEIHRVIQEKCNINGGQDAFKNLQYQKDHIQDCIQNTINITAVHAEVEEAKKDGSMDEVFGRHCKKIPDVIACVKELMNATGECLEGKERDNLDVVVNVTRSLLDFICSKDGDHIAMFIAEGGVECLEHRKDGLQNCINSTFSKRVPKEIGVETLPLLMFEKEDCSDFEELQECSVKEMEKCEDHTPANIIDALFKFLKRVTPCGAFRDELRALKTNSATNILLTTNLLAVSLLILKFL